MIARTARRTLAIAAVCALLAACATKPSDEILLSKKSAVEIRAMQSRVFDTADRPKTLRTVIAMLQDIGYTIDKVEPAAGTVSATKLAALRVTVSIYPRGKKQTVVRSNAAARWGQQMYQVDDPAFYQQRIFEPLAKAMFLTALQIEDKDAAEMEPDKAKAEAKPDADSAGAAKQSGQN